MQALFLLAFAIGLLQLAGPRPPGRPIARGAAARGAPGRARGGQRLRLQLPGACVARRRIRGLGGDRARPCRRPRERSPRRFGSSAWRRRPCSSRSGCCVAADRSRGEPDRRLRRLRDLRPRRAPVSATSSTASRRSRRSGSGPRATSASSRATARSRRSSSTRARPSASRRSASGLRGGGAGASARCPPCSRRRRCSGSTRCSPGTPYQEAKALVLAAPLVALVSVRALVAAAPALRHRRLPARGRRLERAGAGQRAGRAERLLTGAGRAAGRARSAGSTLVVAPRDLLDEQHGRDYLLWELRGNRICVVPRRRRGDRAGHQRRRSA